MGLVRVTVAVAMAVGSKATTTTTTTTLLPPIHTWESLRQTNREVAAASYSRCAHSISIHFLVLSLFVVVAAVAVVGRVLRLFPAFADGCGGLLDASIC